MQVHATESHQCRCILLSHNNAGAYYGVTSMQVPTEAHQCRCILLTHINAGAYY